MDFSSAAEAFSPQDYAAINLEADHCLHALNKQASCEACYAICPSDAIQPGKPPSLNAQACVACMACLPVCPVGAFSGEDRVKSLLSAAARAVEKHKVKQIDLLCDKHTRPASGPADSTLGLRIQGCLAQIGVGGYLGLLALGVEKITVRLEDCGQCPWGALRGRVIEQIDQACGLFSPWFNPAQIAWLDSLEEKDSYNRPGWNADSPPISRAELLRPAASTASSKFGPLIAPDPLTARKQRLSLDRSRRIATLRLLTENAGLPQTSSAAQVIYTRALVDERCNGCNVCAQACPTRAIQREVIEDRQYRLLFDPARCVDCQVCAAMCPEEAITLESPAPVTYLLAGQHLLHSGSLIRCQSCNTLFSPKVGELLCPTCQFRRDNPLGARMPFKRTS